MEIEHLKIKKLAIRGLLLFNLAVNQLLNNIEHTDTHTFIDSLPRFLTQEILIELPPSLSGILAGSLSAITFSFSCFYSSPHNKLQAIASSIRRE